MHFKRLISIVIAAACILSYGCTGAYIQPEEVTQELAAETEAWTDIQTEPETVPEETSSEEEGSEETVSSEAASSEPVSEETSSEETSSEETGSSENPAGEPSSAGISRTMIIETEKGAVEAGVKAGRLTYVDVSGNVYKTAFHEDWPLNDYDPNAFILKEHELTKDLRMTYDSEEYTCRLGVDVFEQHGGIDWWAVKFVGYDFAIMRGGYRGYKYPSLVLDDRVIENVEGALKYDLDVGVYFFSQAISEQEAEEEADFLIDALEEAGFGPEDIKMGIIFDPESISHDEARTDDVTKSQFTLNAIAFCEEVRARGYKSMIYSNMVWETQKFDLGKLADYPIWYADYYEKPQSPYAFEMWQYGHGIIAGIAAQADVNIQLIRKDAVSEEESTGSKDSAETSEESESGS